MPKGRQKTGLPTKTRWLTTRATDDDLETLRRGAELAGLTVSEFTRLTALDAAKALQSRDHSQVARWLWSTGNLFMTTLDSKNPR